MKSFGAKSVRAVRLVAGSNALRHISLRIMSCAVPIYACAVQHKYDVFECSAAFGCSGLCSVCSEGRNAIGTARRSYLACP